MKIDIHVHCDSPDKADLRNILREAEKNDVALCVMSCSPCGDHDSLYPKNDVVAGICRECPERLVPFAWVDLWEQVDAMDVDRLAARGFRGLKFIRPYHPYDHDLYMPVYERAQACGLPTLFHTGLYRPSSHDAEQRRPILANMNPVTLDRVARSFPALKIVMAHMGTSLWRSEGFILAQLHPNLYADLAGCGNFRLSPQVLAAFLQGDCRPGASTPQGLDKLVFGSDAYFRYPHLVGDALDGYGQLLDELGAPDGTRRKVMGDTVAGWLGLR